MKEIPPALWAHLQGEVLTTALLWRIDKKDGSLIRGTSHDQDIEIEESGDSPSDGSAGVYFAQSNITGSKLRSTSDMAVDNMEVDGAIPPPDSQTIDVTVRDIEAGLLDYAPVTVWLCNWASPSDGVVAVKSGTLGEIKRDSDSRYSTEIRGLSQALSQVFVRTYGERCQVRAFGDAECGVDVPALTETGTVTAVTSRRRFDAMLTGGNPAGYFSLGLLTFTSGLNDTFTREVRKDDVDDIAGHIAVWDVFPDTVQVGDTFTISPGCDRRASTCKDKYSNLLNFRGYGIFVEGLDAMMKGPT